MRTLIQIQLVRKTHPTIFAKQKVTLIRTRFHDTMADTETKPWTIEKELWVENRLGLHARPVAKIATAAQQFDADLTLEKDGLVVNARDLLDVLALDCPQGTRIVLRARGPQAREAATSITSLFARKFEET